MHVVLVHGMGGSPRSWSLVAPLLDAAGVAYSLADNASRSLHDDVAAVVQLIDEADDDVILVGHSYGGAVITNAGRHDRVRGLVYVAAFVPDEGETVSELVDRYPSTGLDRYFTRGPDGEWMPADSPEARAALAWDVPDEIWEQRLEDRRVSSDEIFQTPTGVPAWRRAPAWYLMATQDRHIHPDAQRGMAGNAGAEISTVDTSHAVPHAAPHATVDLIVRVAQSLDA